MNRPRLILRISQAHVAPGMSLARWQEIVTRHTRGLPGAGGLALTADATAWDAVGDGDLAAMVEEIAGIVAGEKRLSAMDLIERI